MSIQKTRSIVKHKELTFSNPSGSHLPRKKKISSAYDMSQSKALVMLGNKTILQNKLNISKISELLLVVFKSLVKHLNVIQIKQFLSNIGVSSLMPITIMNIIIK